MCQKPEVCSRVQKAQIGSGVQLIPVERSKKTGLQTKSEGQPPHESMPDSKLKEKQTENGQCERKKLHRPRGEKTRKNMGRRRGGTIQYNAPPATKLPTLHSTGPLENNGGNPQNRSGRGKKSYTAKSCSGAEKKEVSQDSLTQYD